jgi:hypothetical protein
MKLKLGSSADKVIRLRLIKIILREDEIWFMKFTNDLILNVIDDFVSVAPYLRNKDIFRNERKEMEIMLQMHDKKLMNAVVSH